MRKHKNNSILTLNALHIHAVSFKTFFGTTNTYFLDICVQGTYTYSCGMLHMREFETNSNANYTVKPIFWKYSVEIFSFNINGNAEVIYATRMFSKWCAPARLPCGAAPNLIIWRCWKLNYLIIRIVINQCKPKLSGNLIHAKVYETFPNWQTNI